MREKNNTEQPKAVFGSSKWIWAEDNTRCGDLVIFRRVITLDKVPKTVVCRIAAETRYFFSINGKEAVMDGGLFRSSQNVGYYDEIDIARALSKGANALTFVCRYYGNGGNDMSVAPAAGFIFECEELKLYSDSEFKVYRNPAFKVTEGDNKDFGGQDMTYDATLEGKLESYRLPEYASELFVKATEYGDYPSKPFGKLEPRPVPPFGFSQTVKTKKYVKCPPKVIFGRAADVYEVTLPKAMWVYPQFDVVATGGDKIDVVTDRYEVGYAGDESREPHLSRRLSYSCSNELVSFEFPEAVYGSKLVYYVSPTAKVVSLGYRESYFASRPSFTLKSNLRLLDTLMTKCVDTLKNCMRDTLMSSPERDRSVSLFDLSIESGALLAGFDSAAVGLVERSLRDVAESDKNLASYLPGISPKEVSVAALTFASEFGAVAEYYRYTGDTELVSALLPKIMGHLSGYEVTVGGFVKLKDEEIDYHYNVDKVLIINALYYSALRFAEKLSYVTEQERYLPLIKGRKEGIEKAFAATYDGTAFTTAGFYDDRANALAVLCSLAGETQAASISKVLSRVYCSSGGKECLPLYALGKSGYGDLMLRRMLARYHYGITAPQSTLPEDFDGAGNTCSGVAAAPLYAVINYVIGLGRDESGSYKLTPDLRAFTDLEFEIELGEGRLGLYYRKTPVRVEFIVDNRTRYDITLMLSAEKLGAQAAAEPMRTLKLTRGKNKFIL